MPYNPGVTDISGQIRAQGIVGGAQTIANGINNAGNTIRQQQEEYRQNEMKRRLADAAFNGATQADPSVMQELMKDPETAKLLQKRQGGKATLSDSMYLAGMVGAYGKAKEEKQANDFRAMQMQREKDVEQRRAQALNELAKLERTNFDGIDSTTAGALQDVLAATKYSGRPMDPEHIAAFVQNARDKEQRNYLEQMKLEARNASGNVTTIDGQKFIEQPNGTLVQVREPRADSAAPNKDGTIIVDPVSGRPYIYKRGQQFDLATGAPRIVPKMDQWGSPTGETQENPMLTRADAKQRTSTTGMRLPMGGYMPGGDGQGGAEDIDPASLDDLIDKPKPKPATPSKAPEIDNRAPDGKKPFVIIRRN